MESLLLGLYDKDGLLNYVGRAPVYSNAAEIERMIEPLIGGQGFTGRAPGGRSRWSGEDPQAGSVEAGPGGGGKR